VAWSLIVWLALVAMPPPAGLQSNPWHYFAVFAAAIVAMVLSTMPARCSGAARAAGPGQRPLNCAGRFSMKARMPSAMSSVLNSGSS
jgi:hypothetical protein